MAKTDIAYMAGFFDGEGSIGFYANTKDRSWHITCSIQQAGSYASQLFKFNFGGKVYHSKPGKKANYDTYHWYISDTKALDFLTAILPYLKLKHPQAELAIQSQKRKMQNWHRGKKIPPEERVLREAELILMKQLKKESYEC